MQAMLQNMMHQTLHTNIGEEVSCLSWENGEMIEYRGVLKEVRPFDGIMIDDDFVIFVSKEKVVHQITKLTDGKVLYMNPDTLGYGEEEMLEDKGVKYK